MSKPGARTKATEETVNDILDVLKQGGGRIKACKTGGICHETFMNWINTKSEFSEAVKKAEEEGKLFNRERHLSNINEAGMNPDRWTASAWWLERVYPDEFAKREPTRIEHSGSVGNVNLTFEQAYLLKYGCKPDDDVSLGDSDSL